MAVGASSLVWVPAASAGLDADFSSAPESAAFTFDGGERTTWIELGQRVSNPLVPGTDDLSGRRIQNRSTRLSGTEGQIIIDNVAVQSLCPQVAGHVYGPQVGIRGAHSANGIPYTRAEANARRMS